MSFIAAFPREELGAYVHCAPGRSLTQLHLSGRLLMGSVLCVFNQFFLFFILTDKFNLNFQIYIIPGHVLFVIISRKDVCIILISSPFSLGTSSPIHMRDACMHTSFFHLLDFDHW